MRRKTKNTLTLICGVLALALLTGLVLNLYGVFKEKKVNPDNLVNSGISGYKDADTYNNGYGVKYTVEKDGTVKASGAANEYIYATPDGTFTASSSTDTYNVEVYVMKDAKVFATFRPVLVEGKTAGDFLVKAD